MPLSIASAVCMLQGGFLLFSSKAPDHSATVANPSTPSVATTSLLSSFHLKRSPRTS